MRDGTAEPVSRGQILRRDREEGNIIFPYLPDHEQDWQPYPVDPYSCNNMCNHTLNMTETPFAPKPFSLIVLFRNVRVIFYTPQLKGSLESESRCTSQRFAPGERSTSTNR